MKVVVTGATGFIGSALVRALRQRGDEVVALTRSVAKARQTLGPDVELLEWHPPDLGPWTEAFNGTEGVVNLAGEPVEERAWTEVQKARILASRVEVTKAIVEAIKQASPRPSVLVSGSGIDYYAPQGNAPLTESSAAGTGFLAGVVKTWEEAAREVERLGVRLVIIRSGIVLAAGGGFPLQLTQLPRIVLNQERGALPGMVWPFRFFLGGPVGYPAQWISWIHIEDEVGLIIYALTHDTVRGVVNATAPNPVTMDVFSRQIGQAVGRPSWMPLLGPLLKLALGERSEPLLASRRVLPVAAESAGYRFRHPQSDEALHSLLSLGYAG